MVSIHDIYTRNIMKSTCNRREYVYGINVRHMTLMDMATIAMKELRKIGTLNDLDISEEINACSI